MKRYSLAASEEAAEDSSDNFAAVFAEFASDLRAGGAHGGFHHGFSGGLAGPGSRSCSLGSGGFFCSLLFGFGFCFGGFEFGSLSCGLFGAFGEDFVGGLSVYGVVVKSGDGGVGHDFGALFGSSGAEPGTGRADQGLLDDNWGSFAFQSADEGFPDSELGDDFFGAECGIDSECGGGGFDGFLVAGGEGAEGVLIAVAELTENAVGDIQRILGDEVNTDAF